MGEGRGRGGYVRLARLWAVVFAITGLAFAVVPDRAGAFMTWAARLVRLSGTVDTPAGGLWHVLAVSLMVAVTGLAWASARRPDEAWSYVTLLAVKLTSTAGFAVLAVVLAPLWLLAALADGFVVFSLWAARRASREAGSDQTPPPGFARRYAGQRPFFEVWFGKLNLPEGAFWFRYTVLDGAVREAGTWAVWFDSCAGVVAGRERHPLGDLSPAGVPVLPAEGEPGRFRGRHQVFHLGRAHLDTANAVGQAGPLAWDLAFSDSGRRFDHVPRLVRSLRVAKARYVAPFCDIRFHGTIRVGDREIAVRDAPGMIGHIDGTRSGHSWAWAHCNSFDGRPAAVFEGLSARILLAGRPSPPLSSFVLWLGERCYRFSSTWKIAAARSEIAEGRWTFATEAGGITLEGEACVPDPGQVALVTYTDTDGSLQWCRNTKRARLHLRLRDPTGGLDLELISSGAASFELVDRLKPDLPVHL